MSAAAVELRPKIGILSSIGHPLLGMLMAQLRGEGVRDYCVILDRKTFGARDAAIWQERTDGAFDGEPTAYDHTPDAIPFFAVPSHNSEACRALVELLDLRFLVNGGTPRRIGPEMLGATPQGIVNVHPGILPEYRGASCTEWAIFNDDPLGHTAHFMSEGYDDGPIIAIERYDFADCPDYRSIRVAMYRKWCSMVARVVAEVQRSGMTPAEAEVQGGGTEYRPIPDDTFAEVVRKVREGRYRPEKA